eukprot:TRINITY_DN63201_c0_g1_i1.p1 TRINITY_DN63201_c0_g1~~TRINITY_DN63201_c0_g1_i1.p1  ORF type:complete len:227 (-),score=48.77 TRINITY_DN63201_c0_g1_i1:187-867(-)
MSRLAARTLLTSLMTMVRFNCTFFVPVLLLSEGAAAADSGVDPEIMELAKGMKKDKKKEPPMDPTGEHPLKKIGPKSVVCSACKMAAKQFQGKVARKIKGKWKESKKKETFEASLPDSCAASAYPDSMIIYERGDGQQLGDMADTMRGGGRTLSIKKAGDHVKTEFLEGCKHLLLVEFKDALLNKLLSNPKKNGRDIDFPGWLCGPKQAQVCDGDEDSEEDADEEL